MWWEHHLRALAPPGPGPTIPAASVCCQVLMQGCGVFGCRGKLQDSDLIQGLRGKCHKSMNSSSFVWSLEKIQFGLRPSTKTPPEIRNQGCGKPGLKIHNVTHLFRTPLGCSDKRTVASAPNRRSSSNPQGSSLGFPSFRFFWYRFSSVLRTSERLGDEFWGQPIIIPPCWAEVKREDTQVHQCSII